MLTFEGFSKSYGDYLALQIPDLTIPAGIHWVKGTNGSGKTTLFKSLAGLLPYEGSIRLQGTVLDRQPVRHRQLVNYGEAEPLYPDFLTGQELVNLVTQAKEADRGQVATLTDRFSAAGFLRRPVGTYSSGMLKKLSLILAFLGTPTLLVLDEPLITLDAATVRVMYGLIREYAHRHGTSFLLSSHQHLEEPEVEVASVLEVADQTLRVLTSSPSL